MEKTGRTRDPAFHGRRRELYLGTPMRLRIFIAIAIVFDDEQRRDSAR